MAVASAVPETSQVPLQVREPVQEPAMCLCSQRVGKSSDAVDAMARITLEFQTDAELKEAARWHESTAATLSALSDWHKAGADLRRMFEDCMALTAGDRSSCSVV